MNEITKINISILSLHELFQLRDAFLILEKYAIDLDRHATKDYVNHCIIIKEKRGEK